jgi:hypothetical protein
MPNALLQTWHRECMPAPFLPLSRLGLSGSQKAWPCMEVALEPSCRAGLDRRKPSRESLWNEMFPGYHRPVASLVGSQHSGERGRLLGNCAETGEGTDSNDWCPGRGQGSWEGCPRACALPLCSGRGARPDSSGLSSRRQVCPLGEPGSDSPDCHSLFQTSPETPNSLSPFYISTSGAPEP